MADDEKNPTEETAETAAEPEAGATDATTAEETAATQEPPADATVAVPTAEEAAEAAPATGAETADAADAPAQNPPREKKPKSGRHVPRSDRRQRSKPSR